MQKTLRSLLSNFSSLLLAVVLAVVIWITATSAQDPDTSQFIQLPVSFVGIPKDTLLRSAADETIQIRVEGPQSILTTLSPADFKATVDLSTVPFGIETAVPIDIPSANDYKISDITPSQIQVLLEQQDTREIPVELDIRGSAARGHSQGVPLVEPSTITVRGPASRLEQLDFALATVFLNNARETEVGEHRPVFYDQQGRVASTSSLDLSIQDVTVTIPIEESAGFAEKLITVDWIGEPAAGYRLLNVNVEPPSVLVRGLPASVNALTRLQTEPIDITGLTESFNQQATLDLPAGITLDQDQEIFVEIDIEPILTTYTRIRPVELLDLSAGVETVVTPEEVRVVLFGPLPVLDTLLDEDVHVSVDLFGLDTGTYTIEPTVDLPDRGIEVRSVNPNAVTVIITRTITNANGITSTLPLTETSLLLKNLKHTTKQQSNIQYQAPVAHHDFFNNLPFPQAAILPETRENL